MKVDSTVSATVQGNAQNGPARKGGSLTTLLEIDRLKTQFFTSAGVVKAVDGVSYTVDEGETVAVVGESGCGKSVTAMSILRLIPWPPGRVTDGEIRFAGNDLLALSEEEMRNVRNAIGVMVFFGDENQESGSIFIPDIPYFLALFLGEKERPGKAYLGNYWQKGGRYFCISCDGNVGEFITEMDIPNTFKDQFGFDPPPITGIAIDADATNTSSKNGRHSKAYIKKIELLP